MKLLIFCPYYPPHIGGLESHADEFNKYLSQKGIAITVFTPRLPEEALENEIVYEKVELIRFPAFEIINNYPLPKFWSLKFWKLFLGLFEIKFDIVISRTRFFNTSFLAFIYAKIYPHTNFSNPSNLKINIKSDKATDYKKETVRIGVGVKKARWIHIEHGSDFVKSGGKFSVFAAKIYDLTFGKLILKKADRIIANSNASAEFCKKLAGNINCQVIYRGVETEKIISLPADIELKNKYPDDVIITFLGRLIDGKGVTDLLSAVAEIANDNFKLFIIGGGPERKNLENLAQKLKIKNKIIFFGYKKFEDYISILKVSDIFVNPSYTEGLPTTVAEAALSKNAIIATNVGGTSEIITDGKSGFLIKPKNINLLKEKIELLINDKNLRETLGSNAFDEVKNKFNWNNSIEKYIEIFRGL